MSTTPRSHHKRKGSSDEDNTNNDHDSTNTVSSNGVNGRKLSPRKSKNGTHAQTHLPTPRLPGSPIRAADPTDGGNARESWLGTFFNRTVMPLFLMASTPNLVIVVWYTAVKCNGSFLEFGRKVFEGGLIRGMSSIWSDIHIASTLSVYVLLGYFAFALVIMVLLPGPIVEGPITPKGNTPVYKDNGFYCYLVTLMSFACVTLVMKSFGMSPSIIYDHFDEFLGTLTIYSHILCIFLHLKGLLAPSSTDSGSSGNLIFDYYWGTELYPRVFGIDIKVFTNCRFGMTVWPLLCLVFAIKSYELHGFVDSMWVSCVLQLLYFTKFFWWEAGYMRTIDIMLDRAGYYICWGCLVFVPGIYTSTSLYLVNHPVHLGPLLSCLFLVCGAACIGLNYWADYQKIIARATDGQCMIWGEKARVIRAQYTLENGNKCHSVLLISGFWGLSRHFHYVPELGLALFWSLPGLFDNALCYLYFIWLCLLLIHRTFRDDTKCSKKYGKYWEEYKRLVPYKMVPGIF